MSGSLILRDFSFTRDFRRIRWLATIWFNILRAICAGLVITVLYFLVFILFVRNSPEMKNDPTVLNTMMAFMPLFWPIGAYFGLYPFALLMRGIAAVFPDGFGFFILIPVFFFTAFAVSIGDPLVCIFHKFLPKIVPVDDPPLFSTNFVYWVLDAPEVSIAS
jgi:hypothetical protein